MLFCAVLCSCVSGSVVLVGLGLVVSCCVVLYCVVLCRAVLCYWPVVCYIMLLFHQFALGNGCGVLVY